MDHIIRIYNVCHSVFDFTLKPLLEAMDMSKFKDGRVLFRNLRKKGLVYCAYVQAHLRVWLLLMSFCLFLGCRSVPGAIGYGDPREMKQYLEDHGIKCWIDVERVGQVS